MAITISIMPQPSIFVTATFKYFGQPPWLCHGNQFLFGTYVTTCNFWSFDEKAMVVPEPKAANGWLRVANG
jgi:hypothetical protein